MKSGKMTRVWVHPEFDKILKMKAVKDGMSVIELTKELSRHDNPIDRLTQDMKNAKKKKYFDFS